MLELFQFEQCPYCKKVREKLTELNLDYICRNVRKHTKKREILNVLGGKDQVPLLLDMDSQFLLYGSDEIVKFLHENYSQEE